MRFESIGVLPFPARTKNAGDPLPQQTLLDRRGGEQAHPRRDQSSQAGGGWRGRPWAGFSALQCPHHGAKNFTNTFLPPSSTLASGAGRPSCGNAVVATRDSLCTPPPGEGRAFPGPMFFFFFKPSHPRPPLRSGQPDLLQQVLSRNVVRLVFFFPP